MIRSFEGHVPRIGKGAWIDEQSTVMGRCWVGREASIWPGAVLRGDIGNIVVGHHSSIQDNSCMHTLHDEFDVYVGNYCTVGHNANLHGCIVEDHCVIGIGSTVLDGAVIGEGSVVAAGAVVPPGKRIPPNSMVMGIPGKVVRSLNEEEQRWARDRWRFYADYTKRFLRDGAREIAPVPLDRLLQPEDLIQNKK